MKPELARLPDVDPAAPLDPTCFAFGGVAFEMCPAPGVEWAMGSDHRVFRGAYATSPVAGEVRCVVSPAPELRQDFTRDIDWEWSDDVARITTLRVRAELRRLSEGRYAATALVVPGEAGCSSLVTALAAAIVAREGGAWLHAAGVEVDGRAVLFVGPSGAGKTTASNHCDGAHWLARDRAVVYPTPLGWYAAGVSGGDPIELPRAQGRVFPLGGILRVRKGGPLSIERGSLVERVRDLRESVMASRGAAELDTLATVMNLSESARVGCLRFALGDSLVGTIWEWMERG